MAKTGIEGMTPDQINSLAALGVALYNNPKTRRDYQKLIKAVDPETPLPELDAEDAVNTALTASNKKVDDLSAKLQEREARDRLNAIEAGIVEKGLATKAEMADLHKYAKDNGLGIHQLEQAARLRAADRQMAAPTSESHSDTLTFSLPEKIKDVAKNPRKWALDEASRAINEINARKNAGLKTFG